MENNKEHTLPPLRIKKVNVELLISLLADLYDKGIDYVDIYGESKSANEENDIIGFSFCKEYMNPEFVDNFDKFDNPDGEEKKHISLSEEDLNDLTS
jgi:hypothetical protein